MSDTASDDANTFNIVAICDKPYAGPPRHVGISKDWTKFGVLIQVGREWKFHSGPWTFEVWERLADRIMSGDPKALTWPDAQMCLAAGVIAMYGEVNQRRTERASGTSSSPVPADGAAADVANAAAPQSS